MTRSDPSLPDPADRRSGDPVPPDSLLAEIMKSVPECIAAGWVDLTAGRLLGVRTVEGHPREVLDLVAAATADLFRGKSVVAIEQLFARARGAADGEPSIREILVLSHNLIHLFARGRRRPDQVLVVVTPVSAHLDMVITKTRGAMSSVEDAG